LHLAVITGQTEVVVCLCLSVCAQTPLHLAVITGQTEVVVCLLQAGASPSYTDRKGLNSLHLAVINNCTECLRALLTLSRVAVDLDAMNYEGKHFLLYPVHSRFTFVHFYLSWFSLWLCS